MDEIEKKLLKGCSRTFVEQESSEESFCDYFHGLCKECKAKLSQHRQTKKWVEELIRNYKDHKKLLADSNSCWAVGEDFFDDLLKQISGEKT